MLLDFSKPQKVEIDAGFDGGPEGGYVPQMSDVDSRRWKAKKFNIGKDNARIELRKSIGGGVSGRGPVSQVTIFVALDGWDFAKKHEYRKEYNQEEHGYFFVDTRGYNVRISMNGPILMTFAEFSEINQIVNEAQDYLESNQKETT